MKNQTTEKEMDENNEKKKRVNFKLMCKNLNLNKKKGLD